MGGFDFTDDHHEEADVDKYARGSEKYILKTNLIQMNYVICKIFYFVLIYF